MSMLKDIRREMYIVHARHVCLCVSLSLAAFPHYCTDRNLHTSLKWGQALSGFLFDFR